MASPLVSRLQPGLTIPESESKKNISFEGIALERTPSRPKVPNSPSLSVRSKPPSRFKPLSLLTCFFIGLFVGILKTKKNDVSTDQNGRIPIETSKENGLGLYSPTVHHMSLGPLNLNETLRYADCSAYDGSARIVQSEGEVQGLQGFREERGKKLIIVVTPTYVRPFQAMYLNRIANTLRTVPPPLLWLVVEMHPQSIETATLLRQTGLVYRHIVAKKNMENIKDRGVHQRNAAMEHIENHRLDGIVYFADDDNVYSSRLFEEIRKIKRFGTWPVGMMQAGKSRPVIEGPVCEGQRVVGWHTNEKSKRLRRFHVDMCGFAFNSTILWDPARWHRPSSAPIRQLDSVKEGFQETTFIEQLLPDESVMEGLADGCSEVLVWHLHLEASPSSPFPHLSHLHRLNVTLPLRTPYEG